MVRSRKSRTEWILFADTSVRETLKPSSDHTSCCKHTPEEQLERFNMVKIFNFLGATKNVECLRYKENLQMNWDDWEFVPVSFRFCCSVDQSTEINSCVSTYSSWEMLDSIRSWTGHLNPHSLSMQTCHLFSTPALCYSSVLFWQLQPCLCLWPHHNPILSPFLSPLITSHSLIIPKCPTYPPPSLPTHPPTHVTPSDRVTQTLCLTLGPRLTKLALEKHKATGLAVSRPIGCTTKITADCQLHDRRYRSIPPCGVSLYSSCKRGTEDPGLQINHHYYSSDFLRTCLMKSRRWRGRVEQ